MLWCTCMFMLAGGKPRVWSCYFLNMIVGWGGVGWGEVGWGGAGWDNNVPVTCVHSKGIFCIKKRKKWGTLLVHTGGVDWMWKISKSAVSSSWSTRKGGAVNPQLLQKITIWQWRWHHGNCTDFLSLTGHALSKRLEKRDVQSRSKKRTPCQKHKTL